LAAVGRLEGGDLYSSSLRQILEKYHGVKAGAYSYGEGLIPGAFPPGVTIGRYVSIASGVRVFLRNHPLERLSLHPFFYNRRLGFLKEDSIAGGTLEIGHDAWLGERAIITPGCARIGTGAVVGAGAVVTKDVPDFGIVAGNPARLIRYRFPENTREIILASRWWELSVEQVAKHMPEMTKSVGDEPWQHPLLSGSRLPS
jgi:acetyltransferase-like isoleucine patch superfamily enzyme